MRNFINRCWEIKEAVRAELRTIFITWPSFIMYYLFEYSK